MHVPGNCVCVGGWVGGCVSVCGCALFFVCVCTCVCVCVCFISSFSGLFKTNLVWLHVYQCFLKGKGV